MNEIENTRMTSNDNSTVNELRVIQNRTTNQSNIDNNVNRKRAVMITLVSGACAGALAKTVIAPLDRTKIIFQVSESKFSYRKAKDILYKSYQKHGIISWWRGNSATMVRIAPYAALQFTAHEQIKLYLLNTDQQFLPKTKRFVAGALAGLFASSCTYQLDMVRARMAVSGRRKYTNLRHAFACIYKFEGIGTFYNGFLSTIIGIIPYAGTSFFVYETLKKQFHDRNPDKSLSTPARLLYGGIAGLLGQTVTYPLDIVRRRQQTDGLDGKGYRYRRILWTLKYIVKTEGIRKGLYKGLSINFFKGPIAVGVSFATYDTVTNFIQGYITDTTVVNV